ncbi:hypothetical protein [Aminivibrio pyruvatiphilus]|nr:hypothetical protein [Aminivibrio pyruvatiphilus]
MERRGSGECRSPFFFPPEAKEDTGLEKKEKIPYNGRQIEIIFPINAVL